MRGTGDFGMNRQGSWLIGALTLAGVVVLGVSLLRSVPEEALPTPVHRDIVHTETKLYSQFDEEIVVRDFFQDRRDGFFLDVGCAWPIRSSTTYYLEEKLGWSGIGVDANDRYAPAWIEKRPNSKFFAYLISDHSGTIDKFYTAMALGSTQKERKFRDQVIEGREVEVPSITLNDLLEQNGVESIDFLSMDIEESEPAALAGFDIKRYKPELVCIEASPSIRTEILEYFAANGYERIDRYLATDKINWYFTPKKME